MTIYCNHASAVYMDIRCFFFLIFRSFVYRYAGIITVTFVKYGHRYVPAVIAKIPSSLPQLSESKAHILKP